MTWVLLSYAYPPFQAPRAVQVSRLARALSGEVEIYHGLAESYSEGMAAAPNATGGPHATEIGWGILAQVVRQAARVGRGRFQMPDKYRPWVRGAALTLLRRQWGPSDVLVTFGQPWSDHLVGLRVAQRTGTPWVAHFSDPWTANPLRTVWPPLRRVDARYERQVIAGADRLVFTNDVARRKVMRPYPVSFMSKTAVLPHVFDPAEYPPRKPATDAGPVVGRYLGAFYGGRTPRPLLRVLASIGERFAGQMRVDLIGPREVDPTTYPEWGEVPEGMVAALPAVPHAASLQLMVDSDLLLVIDAPAEQSPFLPSKLIDYVGAGKPILALSPPGPSADVVRSLGGWVADPASPTDCVVALEAAVDAARAHRRSGNEWGIAAARREYNVEKVAPRFAELLDGVFPAASHR